MNKSLLSLFVVYTVVSATFSDIPERRANEALAYGAFD
jgi:hypothetical protein